jgi:hypothetical protein
MKAAPFFWTNLARKGAAPRVADPRGGPFKPSLGLSGAVLSRDASSFLTQF